MNALLSGNAEVIPASEVPKAKDANTYRASPQMEKVLEEIRVLIWMAESHGVGITRVSFKTTEADGGKQDYLKTFKKRAS